MSEPERMHREHRSDEDLIELALEASNDLPAGAPRLAALAREVAACPSCTSRLENWSSFLSSVHVRVSDAGLEPAAVSGLAERVLASTTREPVRTRRRSTPWMRVAAAALLCLVPVVGLAWKSERWRDWLSTILSRPSGSSPEIAAGSESRESVDPESLAADPRESRAAESSEPSAAVDLERTRLGRFDVPARDDAARTAVGRMLQVRGEWLGSRAPVAIGDETSEATVSRALAWDAAVRALCCEHLLDRFVLEGRVPEGFEHAVEVLLDAQTRSGAERRLELAALTRAREYGLLDAAQRTELDRALARAGVDSRDEPLFSGAPRRGAPIDVAWLGALEAALDGSERGDPVVCAWLASAR